MKKYANKFKALFVLLLALVLVIPFAACGDKEETTGGGGGGGGSDAPDEYWVERIEVEKRKTSARIIPTERRSTRPD